MVRGLALVLALVLLLGLASPAPAQPAAGGGPEVSARTVRFTLEDSLRAALARSPEVRQAEAEVSGVLGKQLQARGLRYPQVELTTVLGPSPRARGDQVSSPDDQWSPDITGVAVGGGVSIIQPIFTWGLLENAQLAAEHGLRASQAGVEVKATEVALRVKQAYWGVVVAKSIRAFLEEVREQVDQALARTQRLVEGGYATDVDVYRLRIGYAELDRNVNLVEKTLALARAALATWTGQPPGTAIEPADAALPSTLADPPALEPLLRTALAGRLEFLQLEEGIKAKQNLVEIERKRRYPLFFLGIVGTAAYATNRDRVENPFVVDPLYHWGIGPVLGFRYSLDFGIASGKIKEAEAEVEKLQALRDYAADGVPLQVREAHGAVLEARRNAQAFDVAFQNANRMLVTSILNSDVGVGDPRDLADAVVAYAKSRGEYLQALYAYVYGLEQLNHAAGLDVEEVRRLAPPRAAATPGARGGQ